MRRNSKGEFERGRHKKRRRRGHLTAAMRKRAERVKRGDIRRNSKGEFV